MGGGAWLRCGWRRARSTCARVRRRVPAAGDGDAGTKIQASLVAAEGGMEEEGREGRRGDRHRHLFSRFYAALPRFLEYVTCE